MPVSGIDLQVNGYRGHDFSSPELSDDDFVLACRHYLSDGARIFLPTLITCSRNTYTHNLTRFAKIMDQAEFKGRVPGFHLEGPFISPRPGAVGAHQPAWVAPPSLDFLKALMTWADGKIKLLTIAAECPGADRLCETAVRMGITVSLGHQLASYEECDRLFNSGAKLLTHLGNGMPNTVHRHENPFLSGLMHRGLTPMIIADGFHLPAYLVKGIIKTRGEDGVIVTSDASPIAGLPPGEYHTLGNRAILEENGRLYNPDKNCLVGSSFTLMECAFFLGDKCGYAPKTIEKLTERNILNIIQTL